MSLDLIINWFANNDRLIDLLFSALGQTIVMVFVAGLVGFVLGIPLGVMLHLTKGDGLLENKAFNKGLGIIVNIGRSIPFIILLVAIIPFTRIIVGSSIGTAAAIVPLTIAAIPFIARLVEASLLEVPSGLVEAAQAMGAKPEQIILKVLLPEALPGGGLGDVGIRYGYQRFDGTVMMITVVILVALVQIIQSLGDYLVKHFDHR